MDPGDRAQALRGIVDARDAGAPVLDGGLHRALEDRHEQVVLRSKVQIDRPRGHARRAGDVGDLRVEEPAPREHVDRGAEDGGAFVSPLGTFGENGGGAH